MSTPIDWPALLATARAALPNAHAPYSRYHVAASVLTADGRLFTGVNVENASYGLTLCAERNAVAAAVAAGARSLRALCVTCSGSEPPSPCGACRQVLAEFPPACEVRCYGSAGQELVTSSDALLPHAFKLRP
jgi:homotetrameric cytidine deaminase